MVFSPNKDFSELEALGIDFLANRCSVFIIHFINQVFIALGEDELGGVGLEGDAGGVGEDLVVLLARVETVVSVRRSHGSESLILIL